MGAQNDLAGAYVLHQQPMNSTKEQFVNSPYMSCEIMNAIMDTLAAHWTMSQQALRSDHVRTDLKNVWGCRLV